MQMWVIVCKLRNGIVTLPLCLTLFTVITVTYNFQSIGADLTLSSVSNLRLFHPTYIITYPGVNLLENTHKSVISCAVINIWNGLTRTICSCKKACISCTCKFPYPATRFNHPNRTTQLKQDRQFCQQKLVILVGERIEISDTSKLKIRTQHASKPIPTTNK